jgi:cytochrome c2
LIQDQQLAGLLMWIPGGVVYLVAAGAVILKWLEFDDSRRPARKLRSRLRAKLAAKHLGDQPADPREANPLRRHARSNAMSGRATSLALVLCAASALLAGLSGCGSGSAASIAATIGDPHRGATLIRAAGCGACHIVPGINDANGLVGPPLSQMARRIYIAGLLRNTPANMIMWLRNPQSVVPGNAMPDMGLTEDDARDIAAYLYTLQ